MLLAIVMFGCSMGRADFSIDTMLIYFLTRYLKPAVSVSTQLSQLSRKQTHALHQEVDRFHPRIAVRSWLVDFRHGCTDEIGSLPRSASRFLDPAEFHLPVDGYRRSASPK